MADKKILNGYWKGFQLDGNTLADTPGYVNTVTLFVAGPTLDGTGPDTGYLCSAHPCKEQIASVRDLQSRGTEVLVSFLSRPKVHWDAIDIPLFVRKVKEEMIDGEWGLNGVDIDLEAAKVPEPEWSASFSTLIREFREQLGPKGTRDGTGKAIARVSAVAYVPTKEQKVLEDVGQELDWLSTMAYWHDLDLSREMFNTYRQWVNQVNIGIGVAYRDGQSTPLETVRAIAAWAGQTENCGMMQYALNDDCPQFTNQPQWTWASAIRDALGS